MAGVLGYSREAVRVRVKKYEMNLPPEWRKFSVDPQITSLEVLYSILAKAFDLKTDFTVSYKAIDPNGQEIYLSVLSDWDLDAAFLRAHNYSISTASEPCLNLRVDIKPFSEAPDWDNTSNSSATAAPKENMLNQSLGAGQRYVQTVQNRLPGILMNQMERTFSMVQRAFNFIDEQTILQPPRHPLTDAEFRGMLDSVGQIVQPFNLRQVIYLGGIDPSLRRVVWKHILNVYPDGMTGRERMDYIKKKSAEYFKLRETWRAAVQRGNVAGELAYVTSMVRKDVLRTDRLHPFYAGSDDNQNIAALFNILTTFALNHPSVSYCQGMSDIASPLLVTMGGDEAQAFICFCAVMRRLSGNFMLDGLAMTQKFTHLTISLQHYDPEFYEYLKAQQADDLLFCYRWLLLEMKREFAFEDSLRMLEVLWSSLPADPPEKELKLFEREFEVTPEIATPSIPSILRTPRENPYTKICALRRQNSAASLQSHHISYPTSPAPLGTTKRLNHSLDETLACLSPDIGNPKSHRSLDETKFVFPECLAKDDEIVEEKPIEDEVEKPPTPEEAPRRQPVNRYPFQKKSGGHFKELKERLAASKKGILASFDSIQQQNNDQGQKLVKNFNEFLSFGAKVGEKGKDEEDGQQPKFTNPFDPRCLDDSPDDSQEYFPMTTSMTRELRLELENLDRQLFGPDFQKKHFNSLLDCDTPGSGDSLNSGDKNKSPGIAYTKLETNSIEVCEDTTKESLFNGHQKDPGSEKVTSGTTDVFIWENPLHQLNSGAEDERQVAGVNLTTPDEQTDLEYDGEIVDETNGGKSITPIRLLIRRNDSKPSSRNSVVYGEESDSDRSDSWNETHKQAECRETVEVDQRITATATMTNSCEEASEASNSVAPPKIPGDLPPPGEFGGGNPFLIFLALSLLLQSRDFVIKSNMDYNEMAMHFDKMVRKHNVTRTLNHARRMYADYLRSQNTATGTVGRSGIIGTGRKHSNRL
ncbi:TBC1 domain family member 25 [Lutzomyia longipalpis]|uniref:Putative ypt/rab-specific gtpase-activating protein gyp7 n=1 Tax=Lutzomyia longipalpis TaxID=7200 RepID=A0A1B0CGD1_LUTLO|nr:TBC1 domain family member 25 [Lutzomyia longipalpis]